MASLNVQATITHAAELKEAVFAAAAGAASVGELNLSAFTAAVSSFTTPDAASKHNTSAMASKAALPSTHVVSRMDGAHSLSEASQYVLDIIHAPTVTPEKADLMMEETLAYWTDHVNPAFLKYRKSVAEGPGFAALEWKDGRPGGSTLIDARGNEYIDVLAGFGIYSCGHSHPVIVDAVKAQMGKQSIHSQELLDPLRAYCAALLARTLPGDLQYAFFTNSGTESVEACLKMAMSSTGRSHFIGVLGAFHGKTLGSLSATSKSVFRKAFIAALLPFTHVPVNDCDALRRAFEASKYTGNEIAGFIVEPILGEGGIHVCSDEYLRTARALCDEYGACLIFDEVQSGVGRTGRMWACEHAGVAPDLMAIGKGFGGGVMGAGACVGTAATWAKYLENPFLFTTTFGGNPLSMAAAIATMHVLHTEGLIAGAAEKGELLMTGLRGLAREHPTIIREVRGRGLMCGIEFHTDEIGYAFARGAFARRVLISGTLVNSRVLRVEPPLTITEEEIATVLARFQETLVDMTAPSCVLSDVGARLPSVPEHAPSHGALPAPSDATTVVSEEEDNDPVHHSMRRASRTESSVDSDSGTEVSDVSSDSETSEALMDPRMDLASSSRALARAHAESM